MFRKTVLLSIVSGAILVTGAGAANHPAPAHGHAGHQPSAGHAKAGGVHTAKPAQRPAASHPAAKHGQQLGNPKAAAHPAQKPAAHAAKPAAKPAVANNAKHANPQAHPPGGHQPAPGHNAGRLPTGHGPAGHGPAAHAPAHGHNAGHQTGGHQPVHGHLAGHPGHNHGQHNLGAGAWPGIGIDVVPFAPAAYSPLYSYWYTSGIVSGEREPVAVTRTYADAPAPRKTAVLVTDVLPASPAAQLGLGAGDVILAFDNSDTSTVEDLTAALQQAGRSAEIIVQRSGTAEPSRAIIYPRGNWIGVSGRTVAVGY